LRSRRQLLRRLLRWHLLPRDALPLWRHLPTVPGRDGSTSTIARWDGSGVTTICNTRIRAVAGTSVARLHTGVSSITKSIACAREACWRSTVANANTARSAITNAKAARRAIAGGAHLRDSLRDLRWYLLRWELLLRTCLLYRGSLHLLLLRRRNNWKRSNRCANDGWRHYGAGEAVSVSSPTQAQTETQAKAMPAKAQRRWERRCERQ